MAARRPRHSSGVITCCLTWPRPAFFTRSNAISAISAIKLSKEVGVSQSQLSRWLQRARTVDPMSKERPSDRAVQAAISAWPAEEKLRIVMAAAALGPDDLVRPWSTGRCLRWRGARRGRHRAEPTRSESRSSNVSFDARTALLPRPRRSWCCKKKSTRSGGTGTTAPARGTRSDSRPRRRSRGFWRSARARVPAARAHRAEHPAVAARGRRRRRPCGSKNASREYLHVGGAREVARGRQLACVSRSAYGAPGFDRVVKGATNHRAPGEGF